MAGRLAVLWEWEPSSAVASYCTRGSTAAAASGTGRTELVVGGRRVESLSFVGRLVKAAAV